MSSIFKTVIENLPTYVTIVFMLSSSGTLVFLLLIVKKAETKNGKVTGIIAAILSLWLGIQGILAYKGFYLDLETTPPRFVFAVMPAILCIILLFVFSSRNFLYQLSLELLTYIHLARIPVELVLWWLFINKQVPKLMTFEGRNFDIIAGITAPVVGYFCFTKKTLTNNIALIWNFLALGLLLNIVINAVLSLPLPFQKFAFDQPNVAVLYFPFIWLPAFIVPTVLFSHILSIVKLLKGNES